MDKKICVYAICKNEIKFIDRWYNSVKEADYVCVLDTGSSDGSYKKLKSLNIICEQKIYKSFRFDIARNDSMKLIPEDADICVCVDLDEFFVPGWSNILRTKWTNHTERASYRYTWNFNTDGSEGIVFMLDKIHKNKCFIWKHPVHETLYHISKQNYNTLSIPEIQLNHKADNSKSRSNYLPLLELSIQEDPTNDRNMHYLGREYMFYKQYDKAITTLEKHLALPSATWKAERSASLRYIANCYKHKQDIVNYEKFLLLAILEEPGIREGYFELAEHYFFNKQFLKSAFIFTEMLKIKNRELNYISSPTCWGSLPYDYLSLCYYELGDYKKAIDYIKIAINISNEKRLKENLKLFLKKLNNN